MSQARQHLHKTRPSIGQSIRVFIFNFSGVEILDGTYSEEGGRPMIDGVKLHPMRTEWIPA